MSDTSFSKDLETWLRSKGPKTLADLNEAFGEKTFAIAFLLLMFLPSLPLPTGGVTHVFEIIAMLLALELIIGRETIWLPKRFLDRKLGHATQRKALPYIIKRIQWFERFARPRLSSFLKNRLFLKGLGFIVFVFTLGAFLAPPFSGLDTLPSLGVVITALALILEDVVILAIGLFVGAVGLGLEIGLSSVITHFLFALF